MDYGSHSPLIAARGLASFGLAILIGLAAGRVLPAILLTAVVFGAVEYGRGEVMRAESTWMAAEDEFGTISMIYDSRLQSDTTGELITDEQALERFLEEFGLTGDRTPPGMTRVYLATSPDRYPSFVARESGVLMPVAVVATAAALAAVHLRRPE